MPMLNNNKIINYTNRPPIATKAWISPLWCEWNNEGYIECIPVVILGKYAIVYLHEHILRNYLKKLCVTSAEK